MQASCSAVSNLAHTFPHGLQEFSAAAPTVSDQRLSECRSPVQKSVRGWVAEALFGALIKA
jgi:hypothetical protein